MTLHKLITGIPLSFSAQLPKRLLGMSLVALVGGAGLLSSGCQSAGRAATAKSDSPSGEVSLKADRSQFDEARKEIPAETKRENDELAFIRQIMAQGDEEPGKIRERWSSRLRDRREKSDRALRRQREDFNKKERGAREAFLKKLKSDRDQFMKTASRGTKSKEFYEEQEAQRSDFFNDEKDTRKDFESQSTEERKSFESYVTERTNQFNQELKDYTSAYYERKAQKATQKRAEEKARTAVAKPTAGKPGSGGDPELEEFKQIKQVPSTPLSPPAEH